jgi:aconitate hydratase
VEDDMTDSFKARTTLNVDGKPYTIWSFAGLPAEKIARLPYSLKILLENLLRFEDGVNVTRADIEALLAWDAKAAPNYEISFTPARVIMQDFTGVPCVVDLAAMREAIARLGGNPEKVNPLAPAELVIDHSVQVDEYGTAQSLADNNRIEFERNGERYSFLRWGQSAFRNFSVVPPNTGIVHQVNLEFLGRVVFPKVTPDLPVPEAYPDTVVGTDSHTTMINGLGVLGWGVGGIEAEAAMLGQPVTMLIPQVIGFKLSGQLPAGTTATDLVLTITETLRKKGVVDKFVEFFGDGLANLPLADRATIGNMSPEFGSTCAIFPIDEETIRYLKLSGRPAEQVALVETYAKAQGMWRVNGQKDADYTDVLELDLATVEPSLAGPSRPQDRVPLKSAKAAYGKAYAKQSEERAKKNPGATGVGQATVAGRSFEVKDGAVLIAAITSCTNTSNPYVLIAAGLVARNARKAGLTSKPWVKTSLAPGSRVVTDYLSAAGLLEELAGIGFNLVGYGCTTCIGNSGPLKPEISAAVKAGDVIACSVLSGNRNFDGRVHPEVKQNYLASPPLVVAYALAGSLDFDVNTEALGTGTGGKPVYLKDIWPAPAEVADYVHKYITSAMFKSSYAGVFDGDERWRAIKVPAGQVYSWDGRSTYVKNPPYFDGMTMQPAAKGDIAGARVLGLFGDSITTDHISPAGNIAKSSPAAKYLMEQGVQPADFNQYGARRGNHEVMMRGTFANIRLRNLLLPGTEGGITLHIPSGEQLSIYDAAMLYKAAGTPLIILAGKEYGSGSSRDWAAKGTMLLGVQAVIAESFERIHRSNLIGMGVLPLQFLPGQNASSLGLTGKESYAIAGGSDAARKTVAVVATPDGGGKPIVFEARVRIDTPKERDYFRHGGILHYVLRQLAAPGKAA